MKDIIIEKNNGLSGAEGYTIDINKPQLKNWLSNIMVDYEPMLESIMALTDEITILKNIWTETHGKGLGTKILDDFLEESCGIVILEAYPDKDEDRDKLNHFYEKNDFLQMDTHNIMIYPSDFAEEIKEKIQKNTFKR
jgi:hypothetical protein